LSAEYARAQGKWSNALVNVGRLAADERLLAAQGEREKLLVSNAFPGVCMVISGDQKGIEPWSDQTEVNSSDNNPGAVYNRFARYLIEGTTSRRVTPHALPAQLLCCLREQDRPTALACLDESEVLPKLCPTISQTAVVAITPAGFSSLIDRNVYRSGDATASSTFGHST